MIKQYRNKVFNQDVLEVLRQLLDESLDMVYGDPDYNVGINYEVKIIPRNGTIILNGILNCQKSVTGF